ncbi:MAG: hypothetical protein H6869_08810 [Rhodospirillales bacterium]|nr:hypothetical protein [Rhodospirillales bacterium]
MIEAVNSVLQTAQFVRANAEQTSTADSYASNPERVQKVNTGPLAPYVSPYIYLDVNYDKAVIQLRNGDTGDVENQFPSQNQLEAAARAAVQRASGQEQQAEAPRSQRESAQATVQQAQPQAPAPANGGGNISPQQQAAFDAAARSGSSGGGNVTVFA